MVIIVILSLNDISMESLSQYCGLGLILLIVVALATLYATILLISRYYVSRFVDLLITQIALK